MALPSGVNYGQVSWTAISAVADGQDEDGEPDAVAVFGTVTFTASQATLPVDGPDGPVTVFLTPVSYTLDRNGVLIDSQRRSLISLVATDTVPGTYWTWTASYRLNDGLVRGSFPFELPTGATVDLTFAAPISSPGGTPIVRGPAGESAYELALDDGFIGTKQEWLASLIGPPGGGSSGGGLSFTQSNASASWSITHSFNRVPVVALYVGGQLIEADVEADASTVHVTFPAPTAGTAVLA